MYFPPKPQNLATGLHTPETSSHCMWAEHCLSKGIRSQQESGTKDLPEYIFRLQGRHHQLLFK